jgi:gliding motility-associated-like protein
MKFKALFLILILLVSSKGTFSQGEASFDFNENKGQLDESIKYHCKLHIGDIFFKDNQFTFDLFSAEELDEIYSHKHHNDEKEHVESPKILSKHIYNMNFKGANSNNEIIASKKNKHYKNYYLGNDKSKWASNVNSYQNISYQNIYNGIDVNVYSIDNHLKYDFIVEKGANPNNIKIEYEGVENLSIENGDLQIELSNGKVKELNPYAYQNINGKQTVVACEFVIKKQIMHFNFPNGYDTSEELIIDPTWEFSSLTGSSSDNWGFTATYDNAGNFYAGGIVLGTQLTGGNWGATAAYTTVVGGYQGTFGGFVDVAISKFSANGTTLIYSTFLGGDQTEEPHSLIVDNQDNLIIMGATSSANFPVILGTAYQDNFVGGPMIPALDAINWNNGSDIFITKLNPAGSALLGSTYLGGPGNDGLSRDVNLNFNYADHARGEVILDANNNIYIASTTDGTGFPTTSLSHSQTLSGGFDGVVAKLDPSLSNLLWGTYIGGTSGDAAYSIRIDEVNDKTFICGGTTSNDIGATTGVLNPTYSGAIDGFIAKFDNLNGTLDALTYVGTPAYDQSYIIELDNNEDVYVVGQTKGAYPVSTSVYSNAGSAQFIHKMDNDLTTTDFSTVFGDGSNLTVDISITAFLVDNCDNIYVSGWGGDAVNTEGTTNGLPITSNAIQTTTDGRDFYFMVLDRDAQTLVYATYFGDFSTTDLGEHVDGGTSRFDKSGTIYQAVCAGCGGNGFPTTAGAYSTTNGAANCNYGAIKIDMNLPIIVAQANTPPNQIICQAPYLVNFMGGSTVPPNSYWDFGDMTGTAININTPAYTYADTGSYNVMYVAIDSTTCNIADTVYFTIDVYLNDALDAQFNIPPYNPCDTNLPVQLIFTGTGADSLYWDMGNGITFTNDTVVNYTYSTQGQYIITMEAYDTLCNNMFTATDTIFFMPNRTTVNALPPDPVLLCSSPYSVSLVGNNPAPPNSYWNFGDGSGIAVNDNTPNYTYQNTGVYTVMYVAIDSLTCNIADTAYFNVQLATPELSDLSIDFDGNDSCQTTDFEVKLNFGGSGADSLYWDLGDGTQITNESSATYLYDNPGTYSIIMSAFNFLCNMEETTRQEVTFSSFNEIGTIIPNVFTPNGDGMNDELQFFNIDQTAEYNVQIFNRWGKKVYEGADALAHWDGGDSHEGTYFYVLKYRIACNNEEREVKGTVTLLR